MDNLAILVRQYGLGNLSVLVVGLAIGLAALFGTQPNRRFGGFASQRIVVATSKSPTWRDVVNGRKPCPGTRETGVGCDGLLEQIDSTWQAATLGKQLRGFEVQL
ncbi:MAG: hypothetical protein O2907_08735 [Proteobacteria bacterium]|nr:hypothetical protein [Pseudomonadota bacterium]MDA1064396.1 hypothetical protein [Pseudomonadota bacterium]